MAPDDYDAVDLLAPSYTTQGITGTHTHARSAWSAVQTAVVKMVEERLKNCLPEDYDIFGQETDNA